MAGVTRRTKQLAMAGGIVGLLILVSQVRDCRRGGFFCRENSEIDKCLCTSASGEKRRTPCVQKYDCCGLSEVPSILSDDPTDGSLCTCWNVAEGQACSDASGDPRGSERVVRRTRTCPPTIWE